jgi:lipopolysaccharide/colanic/teichoic acid biosynthesis glycosyltransferase
LRRTVDVAVAVAALILLSPALAMVAMAIALDSAGGPFYLARRIGQYGRPFRMWKFRTMVTAADRKGPAITGPNDSRVTRLGRFLRRTKIDELPQFVNLLLGDVTLVGPRPEAPEIVALYSDRQRAVLAAKPGITGRVQVQESCEADIIPDGVPPQDYYIHHLMDRKVSADLEYLRSRTTWTDLGVVVSTAGLILRSFRS